MRVRENAVAAETLIRRASASRDAAASRLAGVHVSDIVSCSRKAWLRRHVPVPPLDTDTLLLFLVGEGHHSVIQAVAGANLPAYSAEVEVPIRYIADGVLVHGTVDLIETDATVTDLPCEIKTTRASSAKPIESSAHYIEQLLSYCVVLNRTEARLYVVHLMGNYRDRRVPIMRAWDFGFSPAELASWAGEMERRHALITGPALPSFYEAYAWECGYCPFGPKTGDATCPGGGIRQPFLVNDTPPTWLLSTAGIEEVRP